ncbi:hypothetical protein MKW94_010214 [Papaver nudicaule]|uniref:Uncharacterized protein n=1 Tax=Papaver nudicaule TaxID=74823 RepID=A0AA41VMT5_PAPNU|nr:hypothetical protein [Papaver nudicaule]
MDSSQGNNLGFPPRRSPRIIEQEKIRASQREREAKKNRSNPKNVVPLISIGKQELLQQPNNSLLQAKIKHMIMEQKQIQVVSDEPIN